MDVTLEPDMNQTGLSTGEERQALLLACCLSIPELVRMEMVDVEVHGINTIEPISQVALPAIYFIELEPI